MLTDTRALLGLWESAAAHLGLFRVAQKTGAEDAERRRILELLPPDLRVCAQDRSFRTASRP
ncbi:hypothetical protein ABZ636_23530 [Streptomyces sp. NPDC007251]|uniref:hypothetical protein n=1 Tax=Streptomyces sp. NPDC007251 TaxID=3154483 RepID=UPI0033C5122F